MGFEPTISCVTGRRALQAAPRGQNVCCSSSGGIRTHSIPGSKPRWSASCLPSRMCPDEESNLECAGLSRAALPVGVPGHSSVVPDGVEPSFPVCRTGVVAVGPRDRALSGLTGNRTQIFKLAELVSSCWTMSPSRRKPWDSNPQVACATDCFQDSVLIRPDDFRLSCGSWNRTNIKTFRASRPTVRRSRNCCLVPGVGIEPTDS